MSVARVSDRGGLALASASGPRLFRGSPPRPASFDFGFQREAEERPNHDDPPTSPTLCTVSGAVIVEMMSAPTICREQALRRAHRLRGRAAVAQRPVECARARLGPDQDGRTLRARRYEQGASDPSLARDQRRSAGAVDAENISTTSSFGAPNPIARDAKVQDALIPPMCADFGRGASRVRAERPEDDPTAESCERSLMALRIAISRDMDRTQKSQIMDEYRMQSLNIAH